MRVMPALVFSALLGIALALGLALGGRHPPALAWHLAFAAGVMPLILGAILHFTPVLTRSDAPAAVLRAAPPTALAGGVLASAGFAWPAHFATLITGGAALALAAALGVLVWVLRRARRTLGAPHPGLYWYAAALACLALALAAAALAAAWPAQRWWLRFTHLHLNTLGFIGLTALGTLQVLLPTAAGRPDPGAAARLRRDLPGALAGVLLAAAGAAGWRPLSAAAAVLLLIPVARLALAWWRGFRPDILGLHGAAASLAAALAAFVALVPISLGHAHGPLAGADMVAGFVAAFLLPLVTGAASQLLPVWLRPGVQNAWHGATRAALGRWAGLRGGLFVAAGLGIALGWRDGMWLAAAALAQFAGQAALVLARRRVA